MSTSPSEVPLCLETTDLRVVFHFCGFKDLKREYLTLRANGQPWGKVCAYLKKLLQLTLFVLPDELLGEGDEEQRGRCLCVVQIELCQQLYCVCVGGGGGGG